MFVCVRLFWTPTGMNKNTRGWPLSTTTTTLALQSFSVVGLHICYLRSLLRLSLAALLGEIGAHLTCSLTHIDSHFWIRKRTGWVKKAAPRLRDPAYGEFTAQPRVRLLDHSCWELADKVSSG